MRTTDHYLESCVFCLLRPRPHPPRAYPVRDLQGTRNSCAAASGGSTYLQYTSLLR